MFGLLLGGLGQPLKALNLNFLGKLVIFSRTCRDTPDRSLPHNVVRSLGPDLGTDTSGGQPAPSQAPHGPCVADIG